MTARLEDDPDSDFCEGCGGVGHYTTVKFEDTGESTGMWLCDKCRRPGAVDRAVEHAMGVRERELELGRWKWWKGPPHKALGRRRRRGTSRRHYVDGMAVSGKRSRPDLTISPPLSNLEKGQLAHDRQYIVEALLHGGLYHEPKKFRTLLADLGMSLPRKKTIDSWQDEEKWNRLARRAIEQVENANMVQLYHYEADFRGGARRPAFKLA